VSSFAAADLYLECNKAYSLCSFVFLCVVEHKIVMTWKEDCDSYTINKLLKQNKS
jgi:hypothetical protein